jgi:catalase
MKTEAEKMMEAKKMLTSDSGAPVTDNQNSRTAGHGGTGIARG